MQATRSGGATPVQESPSLWFRLQHRLRHGPSALMLALVLALVLAISGCGGDSDAPAAAPPVVPPAATGSVSGTVVASRTGLALGGVAVTTDSRSTSSTGALQGRGDERLWRRDQRRSGADGQQRVLLHSRLSPFVTGKSK